ncbi:MAG: EAL domain-containing protein [Polyangiaceae bacterium]|nr:EAL domain-containing protein [Polyangiaceae bacterium]
MVKINRPDGVMWSKSAPAMQAVGGTPRVRDLRPADIDIHFQPIVELSTGKLFAQEALVRCRHDAFRYPPDLLAAAEQEYCCGRLGRLIRDVAFARNTDVNMFINIHPNELNERWLVRPDDPIGFHGAGVFIEITEVAAFSRPTLSVDVLKDICSRVGARMVVDDLGAGHSDIFRVLDLEPDVVKLDRDMIVGLDKDREKRERLNYFVDLCTELGSLVVCEGIETEGELRAIQDSGAPYGQGYIFAKPAYPPTPHQWLPEWSGARDGIPQSVRPNRSKGGR